MWIKYHQSLSIKHDTVLKWLFKLLAHFLYWHCRPLISGHQRLLLFSHSAVKVLLQVVHVRNRRGSRTLHAHLRLVKYSLSFNFSSSRNALIRKPRALLFLLISPPSEWWGWKLDFHCRGNLRKRVVLSQYAGPEQKSSSLKLIKAIK